MGPGTADKQFKVLNRVITFVDKGVMYELDPSHAELLIEFMELMNAYGWATELSAGVYNHTPTGAAPQISSTEH